MTLYTPEQLSQAVEKLEDILYDAVGNDDDDNDKESYKADIHNPLLAIKSFLFFYATKLLNPENELNLTRSSVIELYESYHKKLIYEIITEITPTGGVNTNVYPDSEEKSKK